MEGKSLLKGVSILVFAGIMLAISVLVIDSFIDARDAGTTTSANETWASVNRSANYTIVGYPIQAGSVVLYNGADGSNVTPTSNYTVHYPDGGEHDFYSRVVVEWTVGDSPWNLTTVSVNYTELTYGEEVNTLNLTLQSYTELADWMSTIVLVLSAAIIIIILFTFMGRRGGGI